MKNRHIEKMIASSKKYAKTARSDRRWDSKRGIKVYHVYRDKDGVQYRDKSYWDDVQFKMGSQMVTVFYTHPRYEYTEKCQSMAYDQLKSVGEKAAEGDLFEGSTPVYKYTKKGRKKLAAWRMPEREPDNFFEKWRELEIDLCKNSDWVQRASMKVTQGGYCRFVDVCIPLEVCNEDQLAELCEVVRACLKTPGEFEKRYGDFTYTNADYNMDGNSDEFRGVVTQAVAMA